MAVCIAGVRLLAAEVTIAAPILLKDALSRRAAK